MLNDLEKRKKYDKEIGRLGLKTSNSFPGETLYPTLPHNWFNVANCRTREG